MAFSLLGWAGGGSGALVQPFLLPMALLCCGLQSGSLGLFSSPSGLAEQQLCPGFALVLDNPCLLPTKRHYGHKLPHSCMCISAPAPNALSAPQEEFCFARSKSHQLRRLPHSWARPWTKPPLSKGQAALCASKEHVLLMGPKPPTALVGPCRWVAPLLSLLTPRFQLPKDPKISQEAPSIALAQLPHPPSWCLGASRALCSCGEGPWCWLVAWAPPVPFWASPVPFQPSVSSSWLQPEAAGALRPVPASGGARPDGQCGTA